jgi:NAD(P)-dependent dehydrogenase (short-subunit alcohol dehydrogenase family)
MALITTRFGAQTTADEVVEGVDLHGTRAVVTGAASGIGVETARSLARAGATVTLAVRDTAAGARVAEEIVSSTGGAGDVQVAYVDLADLASVRAFTSSWSGPLHLLVNNAGVMAVPSLELSVEGWERQLATNHLGHFLLTTGLHDALAAAGGARIVSVSSSGHLSSPVVFDDLHFQRREYNPWQAYGQSKTANVLLAVEATRRWADDGIVANALMPGGIMTNLQRYVTQEVKDGWQKLLDEGTVTFKTTQQGAATSLVAAVAPELAGTGGHYLEDCNESETVPNDAEVSSGVREWALDPEAAERLWDVSTALVSPARAA